MRSIFNDTLRTLGGLLDPEVARQNQLQRTAPRLGNIATGQEIPEFLRPGMTEESYTPEQFEQAKTRQLFNYGTPEAIKIATNKLTGNAGTGLERIAQSIMANNPDIDYMTAISIAKSGLGQGRTYGENGVTPMQGALPTAEKFTSAEEKGKQAIRNVYEPDTAGKVATAQQESKNQADRRNELPKLRASYESSAGKYKLVSDKISDVLPRVNYATAGFASLADFIPGTPQADLKAEIDTIIANLGFEELQQMRNNSPTGGALGQVAVRELELLQSAAANVKNSQSPSQLKKNLADLRKFKKESQERVRRAFIDQRNMIKDMPTVTEEEIPLGGTVAPEKPAVQEGDIIKDPKTGKRYMAKGGKWQPL